MKSLGILLGCLVAGVSANTYQEDMANYCDTYFRLVFKQGASCKLTISSSKQQQARSRTNWMQTQSVYAITASVTLDLPAAGVPYSAILIKAFAASLTSSTENQVNAVPTVKSTGAGKDKTQYSLTVTFDAQPPSVTQGIAPTDGSPTQNFGFDENSIMYAGWVLSQGQSPQPQQDTWIHTSAREAIGTVNSWYRKHACDMDGTLAKPQTYNSIQSVTDTLDDFESLGAWWNGMYQRSSPTHPSLQNTGLAKDDDVEIIDMDFLDSEAPVLCNPKWPTDAFNVEVPFKQKYTLVDNTKKQMTKVQKLKDTILHQYNGVSDNQTAQLKKELGNLKTEDFQKLFPTVTDEKSYPEFYNKMKVWNTIFDIGNGYNSWIPKFFKKVLPNKNALSGGKSPCQVQSSKIDPSNLKTVSLVVKCPDSVLESDKDLNADYMVMLFRFFAQTYLKPAPVSHNFTPPDNSIAVPLSANNHVTYGGSGNYNLQLTYNKNIELVESNTAEERLWTIPDVDFFVWFLKGPKADPKISMQKSFSDCSVPTTDLANDYTQLAKDYVQNSFQTRKDTYQDLASFTKELTQFDSLAAFYGLEVKNPKFETEYKQLQTLQTQMTSLTKTSDPIEMRRFITSYVDQLSEICKGVPNAVVPTETQFFTVNRETIVQKAAEKFFNDVDAYSDADGAKFEKARETYENLCDAQPDLQDGNQVYQLYEPFINKVTQKVDPCKTDSGKTLGADLKDWATAVSNLVGTIKPAKEIDPKKTGFYTTVEQKVQQEMMTQLFSGKTAVSTYDSREAFDTAMTIYKNAVDTTGDANYPKLQGVQTDMDSCDDESKKAKPDFAKLTTLFTKWQTDMKALLGASPAFDFTKTKFYSEIQQAIAGDIKTSPMEVCQDFLDMLTANQVGVEVIVSTDAKTGKDTTATVQSSAIETAACQDFSTSAGSFKMTVNPKQFVDAQKRKLVVTEDDYLLDVEQMKVLMGGYLALQAGAGATIENTVAQEPKSKVIQGTYTIKDKDGKPWNWPFVQEHVKPVDQRPPQDFQKFLLAVQQGDQASVATYLAKASKEVKDVVNAAATKKQEVKKFFQTWWPALKDKKIEDVEKEVGGGEYEENMKAFKHLLAVPLTSSSKLADDKYTDDNIETVSKDLKELVDQAAKVNADKTAGTPADADEQLLVVYRENLKKDAQLLGVDASDAPIVTGSDPEDSSSGGSSLVTVLAICAVIVVVGLGIGVYYFYFRKKKDHDEVDDAEQGAELTVPMSGRSSARRSGGSGA